MTEQTPLILHLERLDAGAKAQVGGKNASLGEMIQELAHAGIRVPGGFATTARAYWEFLEANDLKKTIREALERFKAGKQSLADTGKKIRGAILKAKMPPALAEAIGAAYREMATGKSKQTPVAVRSSATAEDLPGASFAGQLETFLNIRGEKALLEACQHCIASLFTDRAISYREENNFDHMKVALSVGVQSMVRSDTGAAGVMFSIDTDTGFPHAVLINGAWGLGESVVQGSVDPDEFKVHKPLLSREGARPIIAKKCGSKKRKMVYAGKGDEPIKTVETSEKERAGFVLDDDEVLQLARWAVAIENHYGQPMDMEWARDGETGELYIVQARPETVQSRKDTGTLMSYRLKSKGSVLAEGDAIGDAIATGPVVRLDSPDHPEDFPEGGILVTEMTDPDWVPVMKRAGAIVTEHGGRTSHAAIVSRELGLPAVVGTGNATQILKDGMEVTASCAEGSEGMIYEGISDYEANEISLDKIPDTDTEVMLILANPSAAMRWWRLPCDGVGLARMEFIINNHIKIHPLALLHPERLEDNDTKKITELTRGYDDRPQYFVDRLARGMAQIAAVHHPRPVIVRMSDFKTNEYAGLIGGAPFEPAEENPMLGWRGASRYYSEDYREGFALECRALKQAREVIGMDNIVVMIPFCRTLDEADQVLRTMAEHGLVRGENGLAVYVMAEIPANVVLAREFAKRFDGFSIGSNDLTQLVLGVDRDSDRLQPLFDESNPAVTETIARLLHDAHVAGAKVGLCGQAPSDDPGFARFLVEHGIDSISVVPDSFLAVKEKIAEAERRREREATPG